LPLLLLRVRDRLLDRSRVRAVPLATEWAPRLVLIEVKIVYLAGVVDRRWVFFLALSALVFELHFRHGPVDWRTD